MDSKILVTADSTCDLSPALRERYRIGILPLYVNMGGKMMKDGVDAMPDDVDAYYRANKRLPTTAAPSPADYLEFFAPMVEQGYEIIHLNISAQMSASHQNALIAAAEFAGVYPVDSMSLSSGIGLLVLEACDAVATGTPAQEIVALLEAKREKVEASFIIDTLEYLWKGGRCSGVAALGANLLKLKPCIEVKNGKMEVGRKHRGKLGDVIEEYVETRLKNGASLCEKRIFITHSAIDTEIIERVKRKINQCAHFDEILVTRAGCTISNHCGPGTLGILYIEE